jgi:DNA-binding GntR family transcriptional regulator
VGVLIERAPRFAEFSARRKLGEEVTRYLREAILGGGFPPGQRVVVDDLVQQLGVSAMPIREALVALAAEGLVEARPRRGFRVVALKRRDVEDIFRVNAYVAGLLADAAAEAMDMVTVDTLRAIQAEIQLLASHADGSVGARAGAASQIESLNYRFHRTINTLPDANRLRWLLRSTSRYVPRQFHESVPGWNEASASEHPAIIDALAAKNAGLARELMVSHLENAGRLVLKHLDGMGRWSKSAGRHPHGDVRSSSERVRPFLAHAALLLPD